MKEKEKKKLEEVAAKDNSTIEDKDSSRVTDIIINQHDFNELVNAEKDRNEFALKLDRISGEIYRLKKDQETLHAIERNKTLAVEQKLQEIVKRHDIDPKKQWTIDYTTRKVIYK